MIEFVSMVLMGIVVILFVVLVKTIFDCIKEGYLILACGAIYMVLLIAEWILEVSVWRLMKRNFM